MGELTHLDPDGAARMVDVGAKPVTDRLAVATSAVVMNPGTLQKVLAGSLAKGEVLQVARVAGIMAAKQTGDLVPLCHPLGLHQVQVLFQATLPGRLDVFTMARLVGRTGVEMEALTAATVAGLTVYDMAKAVDRGMTLGPTRLMLKVGGKTPWCRIEGTVAGSWPGAAGAAPAAHWGPAAEVEGQLVDPSGRLAVVGVPGSLLPEDCWLVFETGTRALVVDGGAGLEFEGGPGAALPTVGVRVTVRLGESHGP